MNLSVDHCILPVLCGHWFCHTCPFCFVKNWFYEVESHGLLCGIILIDLVFPCSRTCVLVSVRGRVSTQGELNNYRSLYFSITLFCYRIPLQLCEVQLGHLWLSWDLLFVQHIFYLFWSYYSSFHQLNVFTFATLAVWMKF